MTEDVEVLELGSVALSNGGEDGDELDVAELLSSAFSSSRPSASTVPYHPLENFLHPPALQLHGFLPLFLEQRLGTLRLRDSRPLLGYL